jgi:hypothetical protein
MHKVIYLEYHNVCPLVRIGTPHTLSRKRVRGLGGPNADDWRKILVLCLLCGVVVLLIFDYHAWFSEKLEEREEEEEETLPPVSMAVRLCNWFGGIEDKVFSAGILEQSMGLGTE